jgi:hypothetical protein
MAYAMCASLPKSQAQVASVFLALVMGAFINGLNPSLRAARGSVMEDIQALSYSRWAMELLSIEEFGCAHTSHAVTLTWHDWTFALSCACGSSCCFCPAACCLVFGCGLLRHKNSSRLQLLK